MDGKAGKALGLLMEASREFRDVPWELGFSGERTPRWC